MKMAILLTLALFLALHLLADAVPARTTVEHKALLAQAPTLNKKILQKGITIYRCAIKKGSQDKGYLTIIDFTKPSNKKRLWVIDLKNNKVLYHTWVAHGVNSGLLYATDFSNKHKSRKSSIGLYQTLSTYEGKHGKSLKLRGHEAGYNDQVLDRHIVVHSAWYISEDFIKKYGRIGRSWGCPAIASDVSQSIINKIQNHSLIVSYYPDAKWLKKSTYLHCD